MEQKDSTLSADGKISYQTDTVQVDCSRHGKSQVKVLNIMGSWTPARCWQCQTEQRTQEEEAKAKAKAKSLAGATLEARWKRAQIPTRYQNASLRVNPSQTPEDTVQIAQCRDYVVNFVETYQKGRCMILSGKAGTGKTHLACAIASEVIKVHGMSVQYAKVIDLLRKVKATYNPKSEKTEMDVVEEMVNPHLLILDEVGVQFGSDTEKLILFDVLNRRYEEIRPTILISNLPIKELADFVGERVIDRFRENGGKVVIFDFESRRR